MNRLAHTTQQEQHSAMMPDNAPARPTHLDRSQILAATEACLKELGYDGTTIRQIAKRLNCAVGSIYRYFKDKRSLLDAVTQGRFKPVVEHIELGATTEQSVQLYTHLARTEPQQYRLMFWLAIAPAPGTGPEEASAESGKAQAYGQPAASIAPYVSQHPGIQSSKPPAPAPPPPASGPAFPAVILEIIQGWAGQLGSVEAAQELWSLVHGQIMLGDAWMPRPQDGSSVPSLTADPLPQISQPDGDSEAVILVDESGRYKNPVSETNK